MAQPGDSFGPACWIFLHILALFGLLAASYAGMSNSKWGPVVPIQESSIVIHHQTHQKPPAAEKHNTAITEWTFNTARDGDNLGLSEDQCNIAFPKQYTDIQNNVAYLTSYPITLSDLDTQDQRDHRIRAMIYNGELYILSRHGDSWVQDGVATVHARQRALSAFPDRQHLPSIEFFMYTSDVVGDNRAVWTYTKRAHDNEFRNQWLMPDSGHWAWPHTHIPGYNHVRNEMRKVEDQVNFEENATEGKDWANVSATDSRELGEDASQVLNQWDHCRFKMVMDFSGRSWSGNTRYIQNCESIYVTHTHEWMKTSTFPLVAGGAGQNFVQVKKDWSDLEKKVKDVLENPGKAERIAKKGVEDFRDRYLTPAAEACYWRALIRGYGRVSFEPDL